MKYVHFVNRSALGTILTHGITRAGPPQPFENLTSEDFQISDQQVALVWPRALSGIEFPELIVVNDGTVRDFLAWSNTYLTQLKPITSHLRVVEKHEIHLYEHAATNTARRPIEELMLRQGGVGLMLGELLSSGPPPRLFRQGPIPADVLTGGMSFATLRSFWLGIGINIDVLDSRWSHLRHLTKHPDRNRSTPGLPSALRVLGQLTGNGRAKTSIEREIVDICETVYQTDGEPRTRSLDIFPELHDIQPTLDEPREVRVSKFETIAQSFISKRDTPTELDAFFIGHLANILNPGALTYVDLITPLLPKLPSALLWYGLCAGLTNRSDILLEFGGVGLRAWREVSRPASIFSRPTADLSLLELDVLLSTDRPAIDFPTMSASSLCVDLFPAIWSVVPLGSTRQRRTDSSSMETNASREEWRAVVDEQVNSLLIHISELVGQLSGRPGPRSSHSQQDFFPDPAYPKPKRNRR